MSDFLNPQESKPVQPELAPLVTRQGRRSFLHQADENRKAPSPPISSPTQESIKDSSPASEEHPMIHHTVTGSRMFSEYYGAMFFILITVFALAGYFLLYPLIQEFKQMNERTLSTLMEIDDAKKFLESVKTSIAAAEEISPDVFLKIDEALPKREDIPKLLKMFAEISSGHDISIGEIGFSKSTPNPSAPLSLLPIGVSLSVESAGYRAMRDFLHDLETNVRLLEVNSISVNSDESTGAFAYTLDMTSYVLQGKVSAPVSQPTLSPSTNIVAPEEFGEDF